MQQIIERFIQSIAAAYSPTSLQHFRYDLQVFARFCETQGLVLHEIRKEHIECFLLTYSTAHMRMRRLHLLKRLYTFCGVARENDPTAALRLRVRDLRRKLPWHVPDVEKVNEVCRNIHSSSEVCRLRNRLFVELAYGSGLRRKELVGINIEDIDTTGRIVRVIGKGNKVRIVPITHNALTLLAQYLTLRRVYQGALFVSATTGRRLTVRGVSVVFSQSIGIRPHLLRHACATHMLANGCSIRVIQELLGHSRISTTQEYTAVAKEQLARVIHAAHPRGGGANKSHNEVK